MEFGTWKYKLGENGKIMPVKAKRIITDDFMAEIGNKLTGVELTR